MPLVDVIIPLVKDVIPTFNILKDTASETPVVVTTLALRESTVTDPDTLALPATSRISAGIVDPIPTFPRVSTIKLSSST